MTDRFGRKIDYMRISITDRCNLRCRYCMPDGVPLVSMEQILSYEEIECICRAAVEIGICKFKITGGEPLVRRGCAELIGKIKRIPGVKQVTLTTNGVLLKEQLDALLSNGLDAVNISLDTLDEGVYERITGRNELKAVLHSLDAAVQSGIRVKINSVLQEGVNDSEWLKLVYLAEKMPLDVRFIEMMPIGYGKQFASVSNKKLLEQLKQEFQDLYPDDTVHGNGPAVYYRIPGFQGSVGLISAIHGKFCESCNRLRLTSQGELKPCLCYEDSVKLLEILRESTAEGRRDRLRAAIEEAIRKKPQAHCFGNPEEMTESRRMIQIGG